MRVVDFPYGKISKTLRKAVTWLNRNHRKLEQTKCQHSFDYPDYWDMPRIISSRLSGDDVDWLQVEVYNWNYQLSEEDYNRQSK